MRPLFLLTVIFMMVLSCGKKAVKKPEDLIPAAKMEAILYELAILNGAKGFITEKFRGESPLHEAYIYKKYGIDSAQFANSNMYYATDPEAYAVIYKAVEMRLADAKKQLEETQKIDDSLNRTNRDSLLLKRNLKKQSEAD